MVLLFGGENLTVEQKNLMRFWEGEHRFRGGNVLPKQMPMADSIWKALKCQNDVNKLKELGGKLCIMYVLI